MEKNNNLSQPAPDVDGKKLFSIWKILLPIAIGLGVVAYMFWRDAENENLGWEWGWRCFLCLAGISA